MIGLYLKKMTIMTYSNPINIEIMQIAEFVAREKGISKHSVIDALEQAIQVASCKKYGNDSNIKVKISDSGEIKIFRERVVVDTVVNPIAEISLSESICNHEDVDIGSIICEPLPAIDLGRIVAQSVEHVVVQKVREAEKEKQYEEFKDKQGEIITGVVKRFEFDDIVLDLERGGEGVLKKENIIKGENFKVNDRVKAYIQEVKRDNKGPQIILSRVHPGFLAKLFAQEVPRDI